MSPLDVVLKFDRDGQAGAELRRRDVRVSARHPRRSRRQRLGDRRTGQLAAPRPRRRRRRAAAAAAGEVVGHQVDQVQPRGQGAADARQGRAATGPASPPIPRRSISRTTSSRTRRARSSSCEGHASNAAVARAHQQVRPDRQVHQGVGQARHGPGEMDQPHALAFDSKGRLFVADRSQQPHPDLRPGRQAARAPAGSSTAGSAACGSTGTTCSTRPTRSPAPSRRPGRSGSAASASAASGTARTARCSSSSRIRRRPRAAPWPPKGSRWTPPATFTAPKSGPRALKKYVRR